MKNILFIGIIAIITMSSCVKIDTQAEKDDDKIQDYLNENNLVAEKTDNGLYYIIENAGLGSNPNINSYVTIYYKGYLLDGTIFDQTTPGAPFKTYLSQVVSGWQQGIPLFKVGGKGTLFIPSRYGYGSSSVGDIPANSVLIFDIELIAVD
jgi:FKBP-type peptidyl-prolyl cis-trans isomerase FkpA